MPCLSAAASRDRTTCSLRLPAIMNCFINGIGQPLKNIGTSAMTIKEVQLRNLGVSFSYSSSADLTCPQSITLWPPQDLSPFSVELEGFMCFAVQTVDSVLLKVCLEFPSRRS